VGVAPGAESPTASQVFIADIESPEKRDEGIDDHEFAVVSEIDLEAAAELAVGDEALDEDAFLAETGRPGGGEALGPDLIEHHTAFHATTSGGYETVSEFSANAVVVNDEKLNPDGFLGGIDGGEDRLEGFVAINQEVNFGSTRGWNPREVVCHFGGFAELAGEVGLVTIQVSNDGVKSLVEFLGAFAAGEGVSGKSGLSKNQK
jgi:hypothetical protein